MGEDQILGLKSCSKLALILELEKIYHHLNLFLTTAKRMT